MGEFDATAEALDGASQVLGVLALDPRAQMGENEPPDAGSTCDFGRLSTCHVTVALELGTGLDRRRLSEEQVGVRRVGLKRRRVGTIGAVDERHAPVANARREAGSGMGGPSEGDVHVAERQPIGGVVGTQVKGGDEALRIAVEGAGQLGKYLDAVWPRHVDV